MAWSERTMPIDPSAVNCLENSSGLRVMMLTVPVVPPSCSLACEDLFTSTELTSSDGSSE
ncbi:hypothetical protein D3C72_1204100 [compost metagenome]